jgi:large subunit ribosomal protein L9
MSVILTPKNFCKIMAKRTQLVLNQDVRKLGKLGDVVEVAPGYARNYLVPQGIGLPVTPGILRQVAKRKEAELQRLAELKAQAEVSKAAIEKAGSLAITKKVGENEAIFGTVTTAEIAAAIQAAASVEVDKRDITIPNVTKIGTYTADVELHPEVVVAVEFTVSAE